MLVKIWCTEPQVCRNLMYGATGWAKSDARIHNDFSKSDVLNHRFVETVQSNTPYLMTRSKREHNGANTTESHQSVIIRGVGLAKIFKMRLVGT